MAKELGFSNEEAFCVFVCNGLSINLLLSYFYLKQFYSFIHISLNIYTPGGKSMQPLTHLKVNKSYQFFTCWYRSHIFSFLLPCLLQSESITGSLKFMLSSLCFAAPCAWAILPLLLFIYIILLSKFGSGILSPQATFPDNLVSPSPFTDDLGYMSSLCFHNFLHSNSKNIELVKRTGMFNPWTHQLSVAYLWVTHFTFLNHIFFIRTTISHRFIAKLNDIMRQTESRHVC